MTKNTDSRSVTQVQLPESSYQAMVLIEFHEGDPGEEKNYWGYIPHSFCIAPVLQKGLELIMAAEGLKPGLKKDVTTVSGPFFLMETLFARQAARLLGI
jgi:hypothetical protein